MAFVLKYPTSRYWIASFYDANGRLRRRSTRETNRNRALEVARNYEKAAKGIGSPQRVRQVLSNSCGSISDRIYRRPAYVTIASSGFPPDARKPRR